MHLVVLSDRYELGDLIGRGGMADVHAAFDQRLQRDVAIKIMRPGATGVEDMEARFEDEARVAARLQHPNVVAVFDTGRTDEGCPFIVMERLPGDTLGDRMQSGPMDVAEVQAIAQDVLGALGAAHAAGVVHRDVKPGNVLMTEDGRAKIADFGIARESDTLLVDPTTTNAMTGTPAYLAPERVDGRPATAQSDLWAVGVVLYEALAGRKPFDGPTPLAQAIAVRDGNPTPLADTRKDLPLPLTGAVTRVMAQDPDDRFVTATEMAAAMNGDSTVLLPSPPRRALPRVSARTAAMAGGAALIAIALTVIGVAAGRDPAEPNTPIRPAAAQVPTSVVTTSTTTAPVIVPVGNDGGNDEAPARPKRRPKTKRDDD